MDVNLEWKFGEIKDEICAALSNLGANHELLSTIGSWGDTMDNEEVLDSLKLLNSGRSIFSKVECTAPVRELNPDND